MPKIKKFTKADDRSSRQQEESAVQEDAGEGHMSKSQLYATAKMAIELIDMINKGDDLEGWVQTKLNLAADYLQAVYHYEDYQKLNPYREELDGALMQKHADVIQKSLDGILARETEIADVDTKPGMMRILKKRVNEVEKDIAKENRKNTDEGGMPASVIKSKQRYANMSDEELADRFKGADEKTLRQMAWRHGYGNMSSHYFDRVQKGKSQTEDGVQATDLKRMGAEVKSLYVHKNGKTIMIPAERENDFIQKGYKRSALRTEDNMGFSDKEIKMAYGVLNNPKYKGGNMTGAVEVINKNCSWTSRSPQCCKSTTNNQRRIHGCGQNSICTNISQQN